MSSRKKKPTKADTMNWSEMQALVKSDSQFFANLHKHPNLFYRKRMIERRLKMQRAMQAIGAI